MSKKPIAKPSQTDLWDQKSTKAAKKVYNSYPKAKKNQKQQFKVKLRMIRDSKIHAFVKKAKEFAMEHKTPLPKYDGIRACDKSFSVDAESTSLATSFIDMDKTYMFRLGGHSTLTASAGGVINTFVAFDPSAAGANFQEWTTLSALFSEFRLKEFGAQIIGGVTTLTPTPGARPLILATNLSTAVAPGSYAALSDNADAKIYNMMNDSSPLGYTHVVKNLDLNYSQVVTPTVEPYAGAPGSIQFYMDAGATAGANQTFGLLFWGIYEFRSRV